MIKWLICKLRKHTIKIVDRPYKRSLLLKVQCIRCNEYFCYNTELQNMLTWDSDFEQAFNVMRDRP